MKKMDTKMDAYRQNGHLLVVSGSVNSVTLNQILAVERTLDVKVLEPNLIEVLRSRKSYEAEVQRLMKEADVAFSQRKDIIFRLARSKEEVFKVRKSAAEMGMNQQEASRRTLSFLGEVSSKVMNNLRIMGLILVGGDTAIEVIKAMGAKGIRIEEEISPGVPLGKIIGGRFDGLPTVTKAGGFGPENVLIISMKKLKYYSLSRGPKPSTT